MLKIFLTNLGKYNEGLLVGRWVELPCYDLEAELEAIGVGAVPYEEYFITDYESDFGIEVGEYDNIDELNELAEELEALDECEQEAVKAYIELESNDVREAMNAVNKGRCAFYSNTDLDTLAVEEVEAWDLPDIALRYFDWEVYKRDMELNGYTEINGGVFYNYK